MKKTLQTIEHVFEVGAPLTPSGELVAWLAEQRFDGEPRLVRLPIVLARGSLRHSLRGARIGLAIDAPTIDINDVALGVGLADRARGFTGPCAIVCEGYWHGDRFDVIAAGTPVATSALAITHAEVEGASHN